MLTVYERRGNGVGSSTISGIDASSSSLKGDGEKVQSDLATKALNFAEFKRLGRIIARNRPMGSASLRKRRVFFGSKK